MEHLPWPSTAKVPTAEQEQQSAPSTYFCLREPRTPHDSHRGRSLHRRDSNASLLSERLSEAGRYHVQEAASRAGTPSHSRNQSPFRPESPYYDHNEYPSQGSSSPFEFETVNPLDIDSWRNRVYTGRSHRESTTPSNYEFSSTPHSYDDLNIFQESAYQPSLPSFDRMLSKSHVHEQYNPGAYACSFLDCTLQFETLAKLLNHKHEAHFPRQGTVDPSSPQTDIFSPRLEAANSHHLSAIPLFNTNAVIKDLLGQELEPKSKRKRSREPSPREDHHPYGRQAKSPDADSDSSIQQVECFICNMAFSNVSAFRQHQREVHPQKIVPCWCRRINPATNKPCDTLFSRLYELTRHESNIHRTQKLKVRCYLCTEEKTFSRADALIRHYRVCHPHEASLTGKKPHRREAESAGVETQKALPTPDEQNSSVHTPLNTTPSAQLSQQYPFVPLQGQQPPNVSNSPAQHPAEVPPMESCQNRNANVSDKVEVHESTSYLCTYPNCTLPSFETFASLVKHRLDFHFYGKEPPSPSRPVTRSQQPEVLSISTEAEDPSTDRSKNVSDSITCTICNAVSETPSKLRKHMRRHDRPYGCTIKHCEKAFGSKYDWRRHECFQHYDPSMFRCGALISSDTRVEVCANVTSTKNEFKRHLREQHQMHPEEAVEAEIKKGMVGWDTDRLSFWCGFCKEVVSLPCWNFRVRNERFDHIAHHFIKEGKRIDKWVQIDQRVHIADSLDQATSAAAS